MLGSLEDPTKVYVVKPSNNYGPWCFPKGRVDAGESKTTAAVREVAEEAGVQARPLPNGYVGSGIGSYSITHYYMMVAEGSPGAHDFETEEVRLVTFDEARELFQSDYNTRDVNVMKKAEQWIAKNLQPKEITEGTGDVQSPVKEGAKLSLVGKIFLAAAGACLVGKAMGLKLRGEAKEINAVKNAILASKNFQKELVSPGATVESVMHHLGVKQMAAQEFEESLGIPWLL